MHLHFKTNGLLSIAIALLLILAPSVSRAAGKGKAKPAAVETPEARESRERGIVALNLGRYEEAARDLEKAYELSRDPDILFSLVTAYRLAGKPEQALTLCASFLRSTESVTIHDRQKIERTVAELQIIVEQMHLRPAESAPVRSPSLAVAPPAATASPATIEPPAGASTEPAPVTEPPRQDKKAPGIPTAPPVAGPSTASTNLVVSNVPAAPQRHRPFYRSPWVWTAVGVLVAGTAALLIYEGTRSPGPPSTTLGSQRMF